MEYIDPDALPLADAIGRIPDVAPRVEGAVGDGPWRLITLDESKRDPGFAPRPRRDRVCPERVPVGHRVRNNVLSLDAFRRSGGLAGTRGRSIRLSVTVRMAWEKREVEPAEDVPREQRGEVWARWLAEGRYRSGAELARACGVSRETVSAAVRGRY